MLSSTVESKYATCKECRCYPCHCHVVNDPVNHPSHYTFGKIQVADALEDWQMNLWRGTAVKYIVRAGRKGDSSDGPEIWRRKEIEDLKKAKWYLEREIGRLEK
jgi:Protein of unknwon function (DUF3310)